MGVIDYIDAPNRDIYLSINTLDVDVNPIDIYKEMRTLRANDEELRKYDVFLSAFGNVSKGGGKATERYVMCNSGTKIVPYDTTHVLNIVGTIITDDGQEGTSCFDRSPLSETSSVDINYIPPQVEVITVYTSDGLTDDNITDITTSVWNKPLSEINDSNAIIGGYIKNKLVTVANIIGLFK